MVSIALFITLFIQLHRYYESEVAQLCPTLCDPVGPLQAPLSMVFSRQEYWSGLPFPSPGDLPDPGIEHRSPALQADALTSEPPGKPTQVLQFCIEKKKRQLIIKIKHLNLTAITPRMLLSGLNFLKTSFKRNLVAQQFFPSYFIQIF